MSYFLICCCGWVTSLPLQLVVEAPLLIEFFLFDHVLMECQHFFFAPLFFMLLLFLLLVLFLRLLLILVLLLVFGLLFVFFLIFLLVFFCVLFFLFLVRSSDENSAAFNYGWELVVVDLELREKDLMLVF